MTSQHFLSAFGSWLLLADICANYLGASYELVVALAAVSFILYSRALVTREVLIPLLLIVVPLGLLFTVPDGLLVSLPPAVRLLVGNGFLVGIFAILTVVRAWLRKRPEL